MTYGCPVIPAAFAKNAVPPLNCFCTFIKNQLGLLMGTLSGSQRAPAGYESLLPPVTLPFPQAKVQLIVCA